MICRNIEICKSHRVSWQLLIHYLHFKLFAQSQPSKVTMEAVNVNLTNAAQDNLSRYELLARDVARNHVGVQPCASENISSKLYESMLEDLCDELADLKKKHAEEVTYLKGLITSMQEERDYCYDKLLNVEVLSQNGAKNDFSKKILDNLYDEDDSECSVLKSVPKTTLKLEECFTICV